MTYSQNDNIIEGYRAGASWACLRFAREPSAASFDAAVSGDAR